MTPSEYLKDPGAQDAVAGHFFGGYLQQYGNPQDAASMWFSGKPLAQGASKSDGYNTGAQYVAKFNQALANGQGTGPSGASGPMAQAMLPQTSTPDTGSVPPGMPTPAGTPANLINQSFSALNGPGSGGGPRSVVDQDFNTLNANPSATTPTQQVAQGFGAAGNDPTGLVNGDFQTLGASPQTANPALLAALKAKMAGSAIPGAASPTSGNNPLDAQNPGGAVGPGAQPSSPQGPQQPSQMDMMQGMLRNGGMPTGAVGAANSMASGLQGFGAGLMSIYSPSGSAAMMNAATNARNSQNNQMLQALQMRRSMLPTWGVTGQNMYGQPNYGWIQPLNQSINGQSTNSGASGAGGSTNGLEGALTQIQSARANGATKDQLLQLTPPGIRDDVSAMVGYQAIPANLSRSGPMRNALLQYAHSVDPTFNEAAIPGVVDYNKKLADTSVTASAGGQRQALQTLVQQLYDTTNDAIALHNKPGPNIPFGQQVAQLGNAGSNTYPERGALVKRLDNDAAIAAGEVGKLSYGSTGGGEQERDASRARWNASSTPGAFAGAAQSDLDILNNRWTALKNQRDSIVPPALQSDPRYQMLPKPLQDRLGDIQNNIATLNQMQGAGSSTAPTATRVIGGQTYHQIGNQWFQE